jgi:hypothetical protein
MAVIQKILNGKINLAPVLMDLNCYSEDIDTPPSPPTICDLGKKNTLVGTWIQ